MQIFCVKKRPDNGQKSYLLFFYVSKNPTLNPCFFLREENTTRPKTETNYVVVPNSKNANSTNANSTNANKKANATQKQLKCRTK